MEIIKKLHLNINYHHLMKLFFLLIFFIVVSTYCVDTSKTRILIVTGGHKFEQDAFFSIFNSFPDIEYEEVVQPEANQLYCSQLMNKYDVVVFYDMVQEITDEQKISFLNLLESGKGMVFLHHSLASYQEWDEFEKIIGGHYYLKSTSKVKNKEFSPSTFKHDVDIPVQILDKNHPITKGLSDFIIHDEVYNNFRVLSRVQPLLSTSHPESGEIIAWTNIYRKSRVVYIQLGHDHHAYENPNYRRLIKQAIEWVISVCPNP